MPAGNTTDNMPIDPRRVITSELTVSHVASDVETAWWQADRALAMSVDDVEREYGIEAYERMFRIEPTAAGILFTTKALVIGNGIRIAPACEEPPPYSATLKQKNDFDQAQRMQEYGLEVISRLDVTDDNILITIADQLNATYRGHTLAEKELNFFPAGKFKGRYCLQSLRVKPQANYTFVLDEMNRWRGITAKIPGVSVMVWQGYIGDASWLANAVAPEKFVVLSCDKRYGDPRGTSMARAIWDPYTRLQKHIKPDMVKTGHQFGGGMITIIGPEKFIDVLVTDPDTGLPENIMRVIASQGRKLGSGGVAILPNGCTVTVHYPKADPTFFKTMVGMCKMEMYQRWFGSAEAFLPAETNSEANASTAQDTVGSAVKHFQRWLSTAYSTQLFQPLVRRSFGEEFVRYAPKLELHPESDVDFATDLAAVASMAPTPYWDDSLAPQLDKRFKLVRDPNWVEKREARAQAAQQSAGQETDEAEPGKAGSEAA